MKTYEIVMLALLIVMEVPAAVILALDLRRAFKEEKENGV